MRAAIILAFSIFFASLSHAEKATIRISDRAGQTILRLHVYDEPNVTDSAYLTLDGGNTWKVVFSGFVDQLRLRAGDQAEIKGTIPKRILVTELEPKDVKIPGLQEMEFTSGNQLYKFQDMNHLKFGAYPRPPGVIIESNIYEVYQQGEARDGLFLYSVKTNEGLSSTWLVRQMGWKAILVNKAFERNLFETASGLKNGRHPHIKLIKDQGVDAFDLPAALAGTWPAYYAARAPKKPRSQFARLFLEEIRDGFESIRRFHDYPAFKYSITSISELKDLIREIEKDIGHYEPAAKKRMMERIAIALETKALMILRQQKQLGQQAQRQSQLAKPPEYNIKELMRVLNEGGALRCDLVFVN